MPWAIALALALTTLLLEDVAIAAGVSVAAQGAISWELALLAVAGGIALGDLGLYAVGWAANRLPFLRRKYIDGPARVSERAAWAQAALHRRLASAVLLARVIPGEPVRNFVCEAYHVTKEHVCQARHGTL